MQPALTTGHKDQDSDLLTSALAAIWFFLAGMATSRVPLLAVVPASSAAFLVLLRVIATLQSALFPTSMKLLTRVSSLCQPTSRNATECEWCFATLS